MNQIQKEIALRKDLMDEINHHAFGLHEAYNTGIITDDLIKQFNTTSSYSDVIRSIGFHQPITTVLGDIITYREKAGYASIRINYKLIRYRI